MGWDMSAQQAKDGNIPTAGYGKKIKLIFAATFIGELLYFMKCPSVHYQLRSAGTIIFMAAI